MTRARDVADSALVHIATETFSAVSTVNVNNVFTSDYDNYKILFTTTVASGSPNLTLRFRNSGSDISTTSYFLYGDKSGGSVGNVASGSQTSMLFGPAGTVESVGVLEVFKPKLNEGKNIQANYYYALNGENYDLFCGTSFTTSCDGFSLILASSTMTGTITVYGYRK